MLLKVARIGRPHGIRGENTVQIFTDDVSRLTVGRELAASPKNLPSRASECMNVTIRSARWHCNTLLLRFGGVESRERAEELRNINLFIDADEMKPDEDAWYEHELLGFEVYANATNRVIGMVTGLRTFPIQDLLIVRNAAGKEAMIPFIKELVLSVDQSRRKITVSIPEGLFDLNLQR